MKKIIILLLLSLMVFAFGSEDLTWTISEFKYPGPVFKDEINYTYIDRNLDTQMEAIREGSKVVPLIYNENRGSFQVRFRNGEIAWVNRLNIKELREVEIIEDCPFYTINLSNETQWQSPAKQLKKGDIVKIYAVGDRGEYKVQTKQGKYGAIERGYARYTAAEGLEQYDNLTEHLFFFREELEERVSQKEDSILVNILGKPSAISNNLVRSIYYYPSVEIYHEKLRYMGINFIVKNNIVSSSELIGNGSSSFLEKLPFYLDIKKSNNLYFADKIPELFANISMRHWTIRILLRIVQLILVFLIFSIARIIAKQITKLFALIRPLSNGVVSLIGNIFNLILNYFYYLYLVSHLTSELVTFTTVVMVIMFFIGFGKIGSYLYLNRCANCHMLGHNELIGSAVVGKKHITTDHSRYRETGSRDSISSNTKYITYTKDTWQEHSTEKDIEDYIRCNNCGFEWVSKRTVTVKGHV